MTNTYRLLLPLFALALVFVTGFAQSAESDQQAQAKPAPETQEQIIERLSHTVRLRLGVPEIDSVQPSQVPNMYEMFIGGQIFYVTDDGRYFIQGNVLDMLTKVNLSQQSIKAHNVTMEPKRKQALENYPADKMVVFSPEKPVDHITVATDVSCGYCRKFHQEISQLLEAGVEVRYLLFPRGGIDPGRGSYASMVSVWCASDAPQALTRAKTGQHVAPAECENPISEHYEMSKQFGVTGTPTIFTSSGRKIVGYVPAAELIEDLRTEAKQKAGESSQKK